MKRSAPKYPYLPQRVMKMANGHFQDTYSGRWLSDAELQRYSTETQQNEQQNKHSLSHEQILSKRWDLNY